MAQRSFDERIEELQKKQEELKEQEKDLRKRASEQKRKMRTRRLIEIGGVVESVLGREFEEADKKRLYHFLSRQERNGKYFTKAMSEDIASDRN